MSGADHYDCLIIGAGISGIDVAYHLQQYSPWASFLILERRDNIGGTWDFFKYPGIRSDSDMFTFGFSWKIWRSSTPIATADEILAYLTEAVAEQGLGEKMRFQTDISTAEWSSDENKWTLTTASGMKYSCNVLFGCMGYYSYETPHTPALPGQERFRGRIVHPQQWSSDCDQEIKNARVALIGSGATSVTLLPNIVDTVEHVTMVQRTPTYISALPRVDRIAEALKRWLPEDTAIWLNRWKNVIFGFLFYQFCTRYGDRAKKFIRNNMKKVVGDSMTDEEFDKHFTPPYDPWQQRFCLAPGGDFFKSFKTGKATIVTGHIDTLTETGLKMKDGTEIEADFIIAATGLTLQQNLPFSTIKVTIDGVEYKASDHKIYKSVMLSDVPNTGFVFGYTNASWTLKADIASFYFCQMINYMRDNNVVKMMPVVDTNEDIEWGPFTGGLTAGYIVRAKSVVPQTGNKEPWSGGSNYLKDRYNIYMKGFNTDSLEMVYSNKKSD